jgi:cyclopropane-fatty-acyl-phospholipid synthase
LEAAVPPTPTDPRPWWETRWFVAAMILVAFESGAMCTYQIQYARDRSALPITRDYMLEAEQRYRQIASDALKKKSARRRAEVPELTK